MVEVPPEFLMAMIGVVTTTVGVLAWTLRALIKHNEVFGNVLNNHFSAENEIMEKVKESLNALLNKFNLWEERWQGSIRESVSQRGIQK